MLKLYCVGKYWLGFMGSSFECYITDCWSALNRTSDGRLQANETTFPSGMKALGDYLHSKGKQKVSPNPEIP